MSKHRAKALAVMAQARRQYRASRKEARRCPHFASMHIVDSIRALDKFYLARIWLHLPAKSNLP